MKSINQLFRKSIGRWFQSTSDPQIIDAINVENLCSLHRFCLIGIIVEGVSLFLFAASKWNAPRFWNTFFNVSFCIVACIVVAILAKTLVVKYKKTSRISSRSAHLLVTAFYLLLSLWGAAIDVAHYTNGEQMLTFYIVQFCCLCFIVMKPKMGGILILLSFSLFYLHLYLVDRAISLQPFNYIIFLIIAILGNAIKYSTLLKSEENKLEIMELNHVLQLEANIDDLTKLKSRNALSRDLANYIGKSVYMIMADIDHFKKYNDTYGHLVGDQVLNLVAVSIKETFEDGEAYRYGGDEFLIVLTNYTREEFKKKVVQWRETLQQITIPDVTLPITCSSGYDHRIPTSTEECKKTIKNADDKLYEDKQRKKLAR